MTNFLKSIRINPKTEIQVYVYNTPLGFARMCVNKQRAVALVMIYNTYITAYAQSLIINVLFQSDVELV
jgi:hypothetical protein